MIEVIDLDIFTAFSFVLNVVGEVSGAADVISDFLFWNEVRTDARVEVYLTNQVLGFAIFSLISYVFFLGLKIFMHYSTTSFKHTTELRVRWFKNRVLASFEDCPQLILMARIKWQQIRADEGSAAWTALESISFWISIISLVYRLMSVSFTFLVRRIKRYWGDKKLAVLCSVLTQVPIYILTLLLFLFANAAYFRLGKGESSGPGYVAALTGTSIAAIVYDAVQ